MAKVTIKKQHGTILKLLTASLRRFHLLIFFVVVAGCVSVAVVLINRTLAESSSQHYTSNINAGSIDQATLEQIQSLHPSNQRTKPVIPSGRINPFAE